MGQLTRFEASEEQIEKILKKYLDKVYNISYKPSGFLIAFNDPKLDDYYRALDQGASILQWRADKEGRPSYFSLQKPSVSYDVSNPSGELYMRLKEISKKAIADFWAGSEL